MSTRTVITRCVTCVATALLLAGAARAQDAPLVVEAKPPPGFEALLEPQDSLIDVYFGGRLLTAAMATFDPDTITFHTPEEIVEHLHDLVDRVLILNRLRGQLPVHANLICARPTATNCGSLEPDVVGVIFDAGRFKAELFLNQRYLVPRAPEVSMYLPKSDAELSLLQNFNTAVSGSSEGRDLYNLASITTLAYGENRLSAVTSYTDQNEITVDTLAFQRDRRGREIVGGLFRTRGRGLSFIREQDLWGVRFASSINTRTDLALASGIPLEVFLPLRSRVDIIKDGRLLITEFAEAGNQILDTRSLPDGAYDVTLRIRDTGGVREETRFFLKATRLPPAGERFFSFEAGRILDRQTASAFPTDTGKWIVRGGVTQRISNRFGLETGLAATNDEVVGELGLFVQGRLYELQAQGYYGNDFRRGGSVSSRLNVGSISITGDLRQTVGEDDPDSIMPQSLTQQTIALRHRLASGTVTWSARRNRRRQGDTNSTSVSYEQPLLSAGRANVELTVDVTREGDEFLGLIGIRAQVGRGKWSSELRPRFRYDEIGAQDSMGYQTDGYLSWFNPSSRHGDLRFILNATNNETHTSYGTRFKYDNRFGQSELEVNRIETRDRKLTGYTGNINTSVLISPGSIAFGGQRRQQSAVVLALDGKADDATFDILVDGQRRGYAPAGSKTALHLRPFETYTIDVRPSRGAFVTYEGRAERVTLYPGNIVNLRWSVKEQVVVFGRILNARRAPLADARISGPSGTGLSDEFGLFQLEIVKPDGELVFEVDDGTGSCRFKYPLEEVRNGIANVGTIQCFTGRFGTRGSVRTP